MSSNIIRDCVYSKRNDMLDIVYTRVRVVRRTNGHDFAIGKVYYAVKGYIIPNYAFKKLVNTIYNRGFKGL